jgi:transposase
VDFGAAGFMIVNSFGQIEAVELLVVRVCQTCVRDRRVLPVFWPVSWENTGMGYNFAGGVDGEQVFLLPPDPRDWLPPQHLAWAMLRAARELDITPFLAAYRADGQGRPAYHPRMMAALIMYCYARGIRSSRAIEMATFDDVGARVICGGLHPDHATVAGFLRRHEEPVRGCWWPRWRRARKRAWSGWMSRPGTARR